MELSEVDRRFPSVKDSNFFGFDNFSREKVGEIVFSTQITR